jgi:hypothetical protein
LFFPLRVSAIALPPAVQQDNDERLAGGGHGLKQRLLRGRQFDVCAIAAAEALEMNRHLLAFKM